jgi:hypothetical protein
MPGIPRYVHILACLDLNIGDAFLLIFSLPFGLIIYALCSSIGSRHYEEEDAQSFAAWQVDFLKYDNCWAPASDWVVDRYVAMRDALNRTGRPIYYSMCDWGVGDPWLWASKVGKVPSFGADSKLTGMN